MSNQKWEALVTAAELGSFSRAAERLGYTQSGLTHMMKGLEAELGFSVLHRGSFGVRLTEEGERILPAVQRLLAAEEGLSEEIRHTREGAGGVLAVGACPPAAHCLLPGILALLRRELPAVRVEVTEAESPSLLSGLRGGRFDLILTEDEGEGELIPLLEDRLYAVLPSGHPQAGKQALPLTALASESILLPGAEVEAMLLRHGGAPEAVSARIDAPTVLSMVRHGLGVGILPGLYTANEQEGIRCLPLLPPIRRRIGILTAKEKAHTEPLRRFLALARRYAEGLPKEE